MGFRIRKKEKLDRGLRRVLREQSELAIEALAVPEEKRKEGIHDFRVACKRMRSVLRLLHGRRSAAATALNRRIGELAGELSSLRDADAVIGTLDALYQTHPDWFGPEAYRQARESLLQQRRQAQALAPDYAQLGPDLRRRMRLLSQELVQIDLPRKRAPIRRALQRTESRVEQAFRRARPGEAEDYHRWRKRVKDMLYQGQILRRVLHHPSGKRQRTLVRLAQVLGEHHDLQVMQALFGDEHLLISSEAAETIRTTLQKQKAQLERLAAALYTSLAS